MKGNENSEATHIYLIVLQGQVAVLDLIVLHVAASHWAINILQEGLISDEVNVGVRLGHVWDMAFGLVHPVYQLDLVVD